MSNDGAASSSSVVTAAAAAAAGGGGGGSTARPVPALTTNPAAWEEVRKWARIAHQHPPGIQEAAENIIEYARTCSGSTRKKLILAGVELAVNAPRGGCGKASTCPLCLQPFSSQRLRCNLSHLITNSVLLHICGSRERGMHYDFGKHRVVGPVRKSGGKSGLSPVAGVVQPLLCCRPKGSTEDFCEEPLLGTHLEAKYGPTLCSALDGAAIPSTEACGVARLVASMMFRTALAGTVTLEPSLPEASHFDHLHARFDLLLQLRDVTLGRCDKPLFLYAHRAPDDLSRFLGGMTHQLHYYLTEHYYGEVAIASVTTADDRRSVGFSILQLGRLAFLATPARIETLDQLCGVTDELNLLANLMITMHEASAPRDWVVRKTARLSKTVLSFAKRKTDAHAALQCTDSGAVAPAAAVGGVGASSGIVRPSQVVCFNQKSIHVVPGSVHDKRLQGVRFSGFNPKRFNPVPVKKLCSNDPVFDVWIGELPVNPTGTPSEGYKSMMVLSMPGTDSADREVWVSYAFEFKASKAVLYEPNDWYKQCPASDSIVVLASQLFATFKADPTCSSWTIGEVTFNALE